MVKSFAATCAVVGALGVFASAPAWAEDLYFTLRNSTGVAIDGLYVSHTGTSSWEENLLAGSYLDSGYEIEVEIADGRTVCEYDILTTFVDGDEVDDYNVDLCSLGVYTLQ